MNITSQSSAGLLKLGSVPLRYTSIAKHLSAPYWGVMFSSRKSMNYIFALIAVLTFAAMGFDIHFFVLWNILPVIVSAFIYNKVDGPQVIKMSSFHAVIAILLLHSFFHIVMYFDIGKSATGSSTSALAFIFIPLYAVAFGGIAYLISKLIILIIGKLKT